MRMSQCLFESSAMVKSSAGGKEMLPDRQGMTTNRDKFNRLKVCSWQKVL